MSPVRVCRLCRGTGKIRSIIPGSYQRMCYRCKGKGKVIEED